METTKLQIQSHRLQNSSEKLASFGKNKQGGLDRTTFTPAELEARDWLKHELQSLNLEVKVDQAANIWGKRPGRESGLPAIAFGSHIDTVPNGGKYDGALGVLLALEVMKIMQENQIETRHPLELVSFSAEEPNPFGLSTFGSRAITKLKKKDIEAVKNAEGELLTDALKRAGGDPNAFEKAARDPMELSAFLEVHIEQGKRLITSDIPVGIVTAITGIYREEVIVSGEANHAGTTLMNERKDALAAAAEVILALEASCKNHPENEVVGTIGTIAIQPNAANIIPKEARLALEIRGETIEQIKDVRTEWESQVEQIKSKRNVQIKRKILLDQAPSPMNEEIIEVMKEQADTLQLPYCLLGSMAGHDAAHMASITRSGMLFVPSIDGKSHCPEEESRSEDIEKAGNVLLHSILAIDKNLD
jgi:N-carbamoyl-L-amino-acid hydrolase